MSVKIVTQDDIRYTEQTEALNEIAAKLGLTKTAVSSRINRGLKLLRNIVEQEGFLRDA